mmetsp:Transcript_1938/g.1396  ORF Transcript_1938/g.1396 Transcript_1938/m.1396 type:complete len:236 (-) Transcript_1938:1368-2075(-)
MIKLFDFYAELFSALEQLQYQLQDFEVAVLMPFLCDKCGLNNKVLAEKAKRLVRLLYPIADPKRVYTGLVQFGLNSKNTKAQAECLSELEEFVRRFGIDFTQEKDLKLVAKMADASDKGVRDNSVSFIGEIYKVIDDDIWRILGQVTPKVQGLLEQRFKKLKGGGGLAGSASSSNLMQLESERSPNRASAAKSGIGAGLKKQSTQLIDQSKKTITPRNAFGLGSTRPPTSFGQAA